MWVRVTPVLGYGWRSVGGLRPPMRVPDRFSLEITILTDGHPFREAIGLVSEPNHPLTGLWIVLSERTQSVEQTYDLSAFFEKPRDLARPAIAPTITGFCICTA